MAAEPGTVVITAGATRDEAFRPRSWEADRDVVAALDGGDRAGAKRLLLEALDEYGDGAVLTYNLACAEAQLGELDAAFGHLRLSIAAMPDLAEAGRADDDLAPLRDDPRFTEILGA